MQQHKQHLDSSSGFELIETMVYKHRIRYLADHLARMRASAAFLGVLYDQKAIDRRLADLLADVDESAAHKVRLTLRSTGEVSGAISRISREGNRLRRICLSPYRVDAKDVFFYHKTTLRNLYEAEYKRSLADGFDEVLFLNEDGFLTEASRHNVFVRLGHHIYTPPLHCGLLNGIYRKNLLRRCNNITEKVLDLNDLQQASAIYLCNAVRGLRKADSGVTVL